MRRKHEHPPRTWCKNCKKMVIPCTWKTKQGFGLMCWDCGNTLPDDKKTYPQKKVDTPKL